MSSIYLFISLAFLAVLYKQDHKEWPHFGFTQWLILAWLVSSSTRLIQIIFPGRSDHNVYDTLAASLEGNSIGRVISLVLIGLTIILLLKRNTAFVDLIRTNRALIVLYAYVLLTILWSDFPLVSLKRFIRISGSLLIAFVMASEQEHRQALEHVIRRYAAICLTLSFVFIRTNRSIGYIIGVHGEHFMAGIATHKNELGSICAISLTFLFWRLLKTWPVINYFDGSLILINIYLLIRAQSATAIVLATMGIALIAGIKIVGSSFRNILRVVIVLVILALPVLFIIINLPGTSVSGLFFGSIGRDATLTGRIPLWNDLLRMGQEDIILGSGYESFWIEHLVEIWQIYSFGPTNAHNGFVDVLLNLGIVGLILVVVVIYKTLVALCSEEGLTNPLGSWALATLILILMGNITETAILNLALGWSLFLVISINSSKERRTLPVLA
jgi:O-antigen ligase